MKCSNPRLLVADDQRDVLEALRILLRPEGFQLEAVGSPAAVLAALQEREFEAAPLRERRRDIPLLATHFLDRLGLRYRRELEGFASDAMEALLAHPWPGNVRELAHAVERGVLMANQNLIQVADLGLRPPLQNSAPSFDDLSLEEVERILIRKALDRYAGNVSQAATALGLSRSALYRRLERHDL